jgi:hypothetical protein
MPIGRAARPGRPAETSLFRSHDAKHRSAGHPRWLRARGRRADAPAAARRSAGRWRDRPRRRVHGRGGAAGSWRGVSRPPTGLARRQDRTRQVARACGTARTRARDRASRAAAGHDACCARVVSRAALCRRNRAGCPRIRRPARQAGALRAGRLCPSRRLQRARPRSISDRIALAAGQRGCDFSRSTDRPCRPRGRLCARVRGGCCCRSPRGHALGRREPDCGRETLVGRDGGSHAAARSSPGRH